MKKQQEKIFQLLKEIIVESETDIHNFYIEEGISSRELEEHSQVIKNISECSSMNELTTLMYNNFGMDCTYLFNNYLN